MLGKYQQMLSSWCITSISLDEGIPAVLKATSPAHFWYIILTTKNDCRYITRYKNSVIANCLSLNANKLGRWHEDCNNLGLCPPNAWIPHNLQWSKYKYKVGGKWASRGQCDNGSEKGWRHVSLVQFLILFKYLYFNAMFTFCNFVILLTLIKIS